MSAILVLLFVLLAVSIQAEFLISFEGWVYDKAIGRMSPRFTALMKGITRLGNTASVISLCLVLFLIPWTRRRLGVPISLAVIGSILLNLALKWSFARSRPDVLRLISETGYSFPSGHAMINASLYIMMILLIWEKVERPFLKIFLTALCGTLVLLIGYSRIYLGVHYAGDVLGGWLFGFALALLVHHFWIKQFGNRPV